MGIIQRLFGRADPLPHVTIRHVVATRQESAKVSAKRLGVELQLAAAIAGMTPDQRRASIARAKNGRQEASA
jgi:hypothetical protein